MNWFSVSSNALAYCKLVQRYINCFSVLWIWLALHRTVKSIRNAQFSALLMFYRFAIFSNDQRADTAKNTNMEWNSLEWNGSVICMTSVNVKFGAKIDSRALNSLHRKTSFASFVLPSTLSGKFAFSCFCFLQLMFYILTKARVYSLNVLNLEVWGLFS